MRAPGLVRSIRLIDRNWDRRRWPGRRRILVNARTAMNYGTLAPVIERLHGDGRIELFACSSENPEATVTIYEEARSSLRVISPTRAAWLRFDAYIAADFLWMSLPRGAPRVQTFHGVAGKYRTIYDSPARSMRAWDRFFFVNRRRMQQFIAAGAIGVDSPAARLVGMPKLDCLVDGSIRRNEVLSALGIDPGRKTVLYAPTWSPYSSLAAMGEAIVRLLGDAGFAVILRLHDRSRDPRYVNSGGVDWVARLAPLVLRTGGAMAHGSNSSRYLPAADVLVTDHSSLGFEYLLLDRPVIRIHVPELISKTDIEPYYVERLASASTAVHRERDLVSAVEKAIAEPADLGPERRDVASEMFYLPGTATDRAVRELYELMELDPAVRRPVS